jgi:fructose transport system permease protein
MTQETAPSTTPTSQLDLAREFLARRTPSTIVRGILSRYPIISPALVLVVGVIVFGIINPRFVAPNNLSLITQQVAVTGTLGIAQTLIILTAGIDLSVGTLMVFSSLVMAQVSTAHGVPPVVALLVGLVVGIAGGALNGFLVARVKLPPFIVTLGTFSIFTAISLLYSNSATVQGNQMPALLTWSGDTFSVAGVQVSWGVIVMLVLYGVVAYVLAFTAWGRHLYAAGGDKEAARLGGISVNRVLFSVYLVAGALIAVAAWIEIGRSYSASPNAATNANLESITAVVIGGTSLFGGRGSVWGTLLGALIVGVFENGLALAGLNVLYQTLAVGILVIVAVAIDQWIRRTQK